MKTSNIIQSMLLISVLLLPAIAGAQQWSSMTYEAEVQVGNNLPDVQISPTAPVSATQGHPLGDYATAYVSDSAFDMYNSTGHPDLIALTSAGGWWGEFTATTTEFNIEYAYSYILNDPVNSTGEYYRAYIHSGSIALDIVITDLTTSTNLLANNSQILSDRSDVPTLDYTISGGDQLSVNTVVGNLIGVSMISTVTSLNDGWGSNLNGGTTDFAMNYSTSVAPEPVSTTLFILGGAFLAGRGYMRKKQSNV